jgi:hypothetical protein
VVICGWVFSTITSGISGLLIRQNHLRDRLAKRIAFRVGPQ